MEREKEEQEMVAQIHLEARTGLTLTAGLLPRKPLEDCLRLLYGRHSTGTGWGCVDKEELCSLSGCGSALPLATTESAACASPSITLGKLTFVTKDDRSCSLTAPGRP